jgi:hypothetical protein
MSNKVFASDLQVNKKKLSKKRYVKPNTTAFNLKWYTPLIANDKKTGLLNHYKLEELISHLVVCYTRRQQDYVQYLYYCFDSYIEFYHYQNKILLKDRCFYEVVNFYQKPHFDIDIDMADLNKVIEEQDDLNKLNEVGQLLIETIIKACKTTLEPNVLELEKDVLIYTSHGLSKQGKQKLSYHIIINNWCHHDHIEAKAFFDLIYQYCEGHLNGQFVQFIDSSVYKTNQNFRIVGSHKHDNNRVKVFNPNFVFNNNLINHFDIKYDNVDKQNLYDLSKSLITFTSGCTLLQTFYICKPIIPYSYEISEEDLEEIKKLLNNQFGDLFKIRDVVSYKIFLKRQKPSHCPLCLRTHFHENPVIIVYKGEVRWSCRRRDDRQTLTLGFLSTADKQNNHCDTLEEEKENNDNILMFGDYSIDLKQRVDYDQINQDLQNVKQNDIVNILTKEHDKYTERQSIRYQGVKLTTLL